jgi:TetR/AcrR family transcriptional regulator
LIKLPIVNGQRAREVAGPRRNAERTRARIVAAARKEFSRSGFGGARVGAIARAAGVNTSLIFYYFQNKAGLYRAVSERRIATYMPPSGEHAPTRDDLFAWPLWLFGLGEESQETVRVALREGIGMEWSRPPLMEEEMRRESFQQQVARVRRVQAAGGLPSDLDAEHVTLLLYILGVYPYMLPQFGPMIAGGGPREARFREKFEAFVRDLSQVLGQATQTDAHRRSPRDD